MSDFNESWGQLKEILLPIIRHDCYYILNSVKDEDREQALNEIMERVAHDSYFGGVRISADYLSDMLKPQERLGIEDIRRLVTKILKGAEEELE